jgi:spore coat polysaccharide biosynthesis protein SpsF
MRKLVACLACRNNGSRLYAKPLQNLDINKRITILDYIIDLLKSIDSVDSIILAISEGVENEIFKFYAQKHKIDFIIGDENDVLGRLIESCKKVGGTDIFRMTTESPFNCFDLVSNIWVSHVQGNYDFSALDHVPDGAGMEIIKLSAYERSWNLGELRHRSELCSLYIREHKVDFKTNFITPPKEISRTDIRLTVDYPEDLILCRAVYSEFSSYAPRIPLIEIIKFLDNRKDLTSLVYPFVEDGLKSMYL